jgi:L-gulonate 5-dehydrogenase
MKSIVVEQPGNLLVSERPLPEPAAGEVRLRVIRAGICGSDVHIFHGSNPFARYPRVIGHEFFGTIDAVGAGVDRSRIGERVVVDPVVSCGECFACKSGRPNVCPTLQVIGVHLDGGFSEYACAPSSNAYLLPGNIDDAAAALVEPFSVAANITHRTGVFAEDQVLLYGAGPIGLTLIQVLKGVFGVKKLVVTDRIDARLEAARANGADIVLNTAEIALPQALADLGIRPSLIIDAACHPDILGEAIELAAPGARIGIMGFSAQSSQIVQQKITSKELAIFSSRLNGHQFPTVIDWMQRGLLHPEKLISHRMPFSEIARGMSIFEKQEDNCCKVSLEF